MQEYLVPEIDREFSWWKYISACKKQFEQLWSISTFDYSVSKKYQYLDTFFKVLKPQGNTEEPQGYMYAWLCREIKAM